MRRDPSKNRLNCFCARKPLLAIWGNDEQGKPYIHIRIYKQGRIYGDVVIHGGEVKLCCRECLRWHRILFVGARTNSVELTETQAPAELDSLREMSHTDGDEG